MRTSVWLVKPGDTFGHGSIIYDVTHVFDKGDMIVIWYSTPTGGKRKEFYPDDQVYVYHDKEELKRDRRILAGKID